jgi:hypothetical protein
MNWGQLLLCGWPGLAHLWLRGSYTALVWAIGFSLLLNLALVATFLWPALLGVLFSAVVWPIIFLVWLVSSWTSVNMVQKLSVPPRMSSEQERTDFSAEKSGIINHDDQSDLSTVVSHTLFNRAQREYLKGHWTQAETLLKQRLEQAERDIEARLLLATLFRHSGKLDLAVHQLEQMRRFDDAVHWNFEIQRELQLIELIRQDQQNDQTFSN